MGLATALLAGCSAEVTGPKPKLEAPAGEKLAILPGVVCGDQLTTDVVLNGQKLSPVPINIPNDPHVALPDVTLVRSHELDGTDADGQKILFSGDPGTKTNLSLLSWTSQDEMHLTVNQKIDVEGKNGPLPTGLYDVRVTNPDDDSDVDVGALAVVRKPELKLLTPSIVCLSQEDREIELSGTTFLEIAGKRPTFEVQGVKTPFDVTTLQGCTDIKQEAVSGSTREGIKASYCKTAKLTLPKGSVKVGYPSITLHNPETAACTTEEMVNLRVVPPPVIDKVVEPLACVAQGDRTFTIEGSGYLEIDGTLPAVTVGGKAFAPTLVDTTCQALETQGHTVRSCTQMTITVKENELSPGNPEVVVSNPAPAGCSVSNGVALTIVPPPTVQSVVPALVCLDDGQRAIEVQGTDFLTVNGTVPAVEVGSVKVDSASIAASQCENVAVDGLTVQRCATLTVTLAQGEVNPGTPDVKVTNPDPAGCDDTKSNLFRIVPAPALTSAAPALVCTDTGAVPVVLTGTFLSVDAALPSATFNGTTVAVDSIAGCTPLAATLGGPAVQTCTTLNVTAPQGSLTAGNVAIQVTNPQPAGCAAAASNLLVAPPLLAITGAAPSNFCQGTSGVQNILLQGTGFVLVDGALPTVTVNGTPQALTANSFPSADCTTIANVPGFTNVQSCNTVAISYDLTGAPVGDIPVAVTNPAPLTCSTTAVSGIRIVAPPTINNVSPTEICVSSGQTLTITGSGFAQGGQVLVGTDCNQAQPAHCTLLSNVQVSQDGTTITASVDGVPPGTQYSVTVRNAAGACDSTAAIKINVHPEPLVFFVDPPVAYDRIAIDATIFTSGLETGSLAQSVELIDANNKKTSLSFTTPKANRLIAHVPGLDNAQPPAPTLAAGPYTVRVTTSASCVAELPAGLTLTDTLTDTLVTGVQPAYVSPSEATAVTVTGAGFSPVPRVYLTPASGTGTATAMTAVEVKQGGAALTAVVPANLTPGKYDLVVVNPDGKVDVLPAGVTVTADEPPVVLSVTPASLPSNATGDITILGSGFKDNLTVVLDCLPPGTSTRVTVQTTEQQPAADGKSVQVSATLSNVAAGSVCLVRLTNADGAYFEYSAFSVTNSSLNLSPWTTSTDTKQARRALSLVAGRPTTTSRYLYAIGGDNGVANAPLTRGGTLYDSVDFTNVDVFGGLATWDLQRNKLPAPLSGAGAATVGRFVYLVGGHNGTKATKALYRAQILDPLAGPEVTDLDATLGDGTKGLTKGLYYYRVAAVFSSDDLNNPAGESLSGELLPVQLPDRTEKIVLTLTWAAVSGAHGYRVYRSPAPDATADQLSLVGSISCGSNPTDLCNCGTNPQSCQLTDDGKSADTTQTPLPAGSLGVWHPVDGSRCSSGGCTLNSAREGHAVTAFADPSDATTWYLYAFGGRDDNGAYLSSYEIATISIATDGTQTVKGFTDGSQSIGLARADHGAWVMNRYNSSVIATSGTPNDVWVYVGGGRTTGDVTDQTLKAGKLGSNGDLGTFQATDSLKGALVGFGTGASNGQLYTFGGLDGQSDGTSASLCSGGGSCGPLPDLKAGAFNALGAATTQRMFMGATQESAFFFLAGGHDGTQTLNTTEQTVQ